MSGASAACPNCGASLRFTWSGSVQTVCDRCRAILVRRDVDIERVGEVSDPPPDTSPIQLGTTGRFEGRPFQVIGRLAYEYEGGAWSEWHLLFDDGKTGWLSDAQLRYAVYERAQGPGSLPAPSQLAIGSIVRWQQRRFEVTTITDARYRGTEGELPFESWDRSVEHFVDLRGGDGAGIATIDYSDETPVLYVGRAASFDELGLRNLRDVDQARDVQVGALKCGNCGAPLVIKAPGQSQSIVCDHCGSIADATDPGVRVVQTVAQRARITPRIPLGVSGDWHGARYQVIGFQRRTITVEGVDYSWDEYVLFNPHHGFRYLSEYGGHWNDIAVLDETPVDGRLPKDGADLRGRHYRHFQSAQARTAFVLGEFPWIVKVGEKVRVDDYVAPPFLLSREGTAKDATWSLGTYVQGDAIWRAFSLDGTAPRAEGVFANQPSPFAGRRSQYWRTFAGFAALLAVAAFLRLITSGSNVFDARYRFDPSAPNPAFVTEPFELSGRPSNVEVALDSDLRNNWMHVSLALINNETGEGLDFDRDLEYYFGVEDGSSWQEGSPRGSIVLPTVAPGRYYLRVEPDGNPGDRSPIDYSIRVRRDRPAWLFYAIALGLLAVPPLLVTVRYASFEHTRWSESDYAENDEDDD
jgi:hypothetical protein